MPVTARQRRRRPLASFATATAATMAAGPHRRQETPNVGIYVPCWIVLGGWRRTATAPAMQSYLNRASFNRQ